MRRLLLVMVLAAAGVTGASVSARAESVFGLYFLGERVETGGARTGALGGFVQMVDDTLGILQYNPATMAWAKRVTFGVAGYFTSNQGTGEGIERTANATKVSMFAFAFPVYKKRVSLGFAFRGRYDPDGEFRVEQTTPEGDLYADDYVRSGGLWSVPFTIAVDVSPRIKVGGFVSLERGHIDDLWTVNFQESDNADAGSQQTRTASGTGYGAGVALRPHNSVSLGATFETDINYDVDLAVRNTSESANRDSTETATLPARVTLSAIWRVSRQVNLYGGYSSSDFGKFEGFDFDQDRLVREEVVALGAEYRRGPNWPIRVSARYETLPYTMPADQEISGVAFGLGTGLLFRSGRGKLDVALQFGKMGSADSNGYSDRSVRFMMSITGSEEWRSKREDR